MDWTKIYEYGISPLREASGPKSGRKYVITSGEVVAYNDDGVFDVVSPSPLTDTIQGNTVENLTELQLALYWRLCDNAKLINYDRDI